MELGQVVHQMIPWILPVDGYLGNGIIGAVQKYGLDLYYDF
jgi:hypothetical protein